MPLQADPCIACLLRNLDSELYCLLATIGRRASISADSQKTVVLTVLRVLPVLSVLAVLMGVPRGAWRPTVAHSSLCGNAAGLVLRKAPPRGQARFFRVHGA